MSLRARLALIFALVVAVSLLVAALSLFALLRGYNTRLVQARLNDVALMVFVQARGMIQRDQTPSQVLDFLAEQADDLEVRILLLDRQNRVAREVGPGPSLLDLRIRVDRAGSPPGSRQPIHGSFTSPRDGLTYVYAAIPAVLGRPDQGLLLVAQQEQSGLAALGSLVRRLALAAAAGLVAGLVAAVLVARWLGRPLSNLLEATRAVASGNYSHRVQPAGPPELVRLTGSFNAMAAEVERSRQLVHRFVGVLSHELRTPLTSIRGFAQAVLDGSARDSQEIQRAMQVVDREARRMQRLSAELLDLSRLQAGQIPMRRDIVDLAELVVHSADVLAGRAQDQQVRIDLQLPETLPILGDEDRLEQIFTNLLDNALKFTPPTGVIRVSARLIQRPADSLPGGGGLTLGQRATLDELQPWVVVDVSNPGPPIPSDDLPRLFEPFYTGRDGQERGGTGLGLPIALEIARAHAGELSVVPGSQETVFRLTLPAELNRDTSVTPRPLPSPSI